MRPIGLVLSLVLSLGLAACFVQHPAPVGVAEKASAGQWSGAWVALPLRDGDEPGFFHVTDVDPAMGIFSVEDADADGNGLGEAMEMRLRCLDGQLFLDVRDKPDGPWMLFVIEEATAEKVVLAWKPAAEPFAAAIGRGDFKAKLSTFSDGDVEKIVFAEMNGTETALLAQNWRNLFAPERIVMKRMVEND
jgi:hypothetical protein